MLHLARCPIISVNIWLPIMELLTETKLIQDPTWKTWLFCIHKDNQIIGPEAASVIFITWRVLYAEIVKARIEDKHLNILQVNRIIYSHLLCRLKAFGERWNHWKAARTHTSLPSEIPREITKLMLIHIQNNAVYTIHTQIIQRQQKYQ